MAADNSLTTRVSDETKQKWDAACKLVGLSCNQALKLMVLLAIGQEPPDHLTDEDHLEDLKEWLRGK